MRPCSLLGQPMFLPMRNTFFNYSVQSVCMHGLSYASAKTAQCRERGCRPGAYGVFKGQLGVAAAAAAAPVVRAAAASVEGGTPREARAAAARTPEDAVGEGAPGRHRARRRPAQHTRQLHNNGPGQSKGTAVFRCLYPLIGHVLLPSACRLAVSPGCA